MGTQIGDNPEYDVIGTLREIRFYPPKLIEEVLKLRPLEKPKSRLADKWASEIGHSENYCAIARINFHNIGDETNSERLEALVTLLAIRQLIPANKSKS